MNKASNQEDGGDRLCRGPSHLPMDFQLVLLRGGRYMSMGELLTVVKWLAEASFLRLLWLQVVRKDGGRLFPEPTPASAYGCHLYLHLSLPRHGSSPRCLCTPSHTLDELHHFSGRGYSQSIGSRLCGELAGGHLPGREPRKSASGVPAE